MGNNRYPVLCNTLLCTGCAACYNSCTKKAISMEDGTDGFARPVIDKDCCVQCLACEKACPVLYLVDEKKKEENPKVYACWNKDAEIRLESSSGGAFSAFATSVISKQCGYVAGAVYDRDMAVRHKLCESKDDLPRLRGSKYVQSSIGDVFCEIKVKLREGKTVLFVGTPCQVTGLRSYLKRDYDNLFCCDFICHGTPSPLLFKKYIQWIEDTKHLKVVSFNFRNKRSGWYDAVRVANGKHFMRGKHDAYFFGFNRDITLRESCYRCPATGLPRKGDITIADYWGVGMMYGFNKIDEIPNGVSLVMVNNKKGARLFEDAKEYMHWQHGHFDEALSRNQPMIRPSHRPQSRDSFYDDMGRLDFEMLRQKYFKIRGKAKWVAAFREYAPRKCVVGLRKILQIITYKRYGNKTI